MNFIEPPGKLGILLSVQFSRHLIFSKEQLRGRTQLSENPYSTEQRGGCLPVQLTDIGKGDGGGLLGATELEVCDRGCTLHAEFKFRKK
jgi:hypothetical protein